MNTQRVTGLRRTRIRAAVLAAVLGAMVPAIATTTVSASDGDRDPTEVTREWIARRQLGEAAARMPADWPATEAMLRAAAAPLGDAAVRADWQRDAQRMPAGWLATQAMREAAASPPTSVS